MLERLMVVLFLASYFDGRARAPGSKRDDVSTKIRLTSEQWFRQKLVDHGGTGFGTQHLQVLNGRKAERRDTSRDVLLHGIVQVDDESCIYHEPLIAWARNGNCCELITRILQIATAYALQSGINALLM